ncbi:glycoside hydrolase family 16 protein [Pseudopedobacter beijingensis]|uniref:Family 16 glycosylhydrolase n=1 Tax=Pseudopedobacter beijingensis TaxID=1207056 RepID=A0ABW4IJT0_9SPHI
MLSVACSSQPKQAEKKKEYKEPLEKNPEGRSFAKEPDWSDEFDYTGKPDNTKWSYDIGGDGWYNNEKQYYTNLEENVKVEDGKLKITALHKSFGGESYTSGKLITKNKYDFLYGRVEVRLKVPVGRGTWPAVWMLPTDNFYGYWPNSGEIDIMEHVGYQPNNIHITIHNKAANAKENLGQVVNKYKLIPTAISDFHVYHVDWTPEAIRGYIDNELLLEYRNDGKGFETWPFDKPFYLLMNLAIGGDWGGIEGIDNTVFPSVYEIDYVRVYKMVN